MARPAPATPVYAHSRSRLLGRRWLPQWNRNRPHCDGLRHGTITSRVQTRFSIALNGNGNAIKLPGLSGLPWQTVALPSKPPPCSAAAPDPVCSRSTHHEKVVAVVKNASQHRHIPIVFRIDAASRSLHPVD